VSGTRPLIPSAANPLWRAFSRFVAIPPVTLALMRFATWVDRPLMRLSRGRLRLSFVIPLLLLRCTGARSGLPREVPLLYVPAGDDVLLVASNGGQTRAPAWCHNLRRRPRVQCLLKGETVSFEAEELAGGPRDGAWQRVIAVYPGYQQYAKRAGRTIPLFLLRRVTPTDGRQNGKEQ
jgi:deazaflavin-dependent oxidoreductase (nitroreductase family)